MAQKGLAPILIIVLIALAALGGYVVYQNQTKPAQVACTQEAKLCPDGSSVGRTGPNCEFASCPTPSPQTGLQSSPTPTGNNKYCSYTSSIPIKSVADCGDYKVLIRGCCDIPDIILNRDGDKLMECGGKYYSEECLQRFPPSKTALCSFTVCQ